MTAEAIEPASFTKAGPPDIQTSAALGFDQALAGALAARELPDRRAFPAERTVGGHARPDRDIATPESAERLTTPMALASSLRPGVDPDASPRAGKADAASVANSRLSEPQHLAGDITALSWEAAPFRATEREGQAAAPESAVAASASVAASGSVAAPAATAAPEPAAVSPWATSEGVLQLTFAPGESALSQVDIAMAEDGALSLNLHTPDEARAAVADALDELRRRLLDQGLQVWTVALAASGELIS